MPLPLVISGTLVLPVASVIIISPISATSPYIVASGCAQLDGALKISANTSLDTVLVLQQNASCPFTQFGSVTVESKVCSVKQQYSGGRLQVLIQRSCKTHLLPIALGVSGGIVVLLFAVLVFWYLGYVKRKFRCCDFLWKSQEKTRRMY